MPMPAHEALRSSPSLSRAKSTRDSRRSRGSNISDPILSTRVFDDVPGQRNNLARQEYQSHASIARADGMMPRKITTSDLLGKERIISNHGATHLRGTSHTTARTSAALSNLNSSISSGPSKTSWNQSKNRGFRAKIRQFLGAKPKRDIIQIEHNIDRSSDRVDSPNTPKAYVQHYSKSISAPVGLEVTRTSALGSHSPFAPSIPRVGDALKEPEKLPERSTGHKRNCTFPNALPSSREERVDEATSKEVGITSSPAVVPRYTRDLICDNPKRRSRSAGALRDAATTPGLSPIQPRGLHDEITYWRNSVVEDPIPDPPTGQLQTREYSTLEQPHLKDVAIAPSPGHQHSPIMPTQTFDFGLLVAPGGKDSATVEQRLSTIEVKLVDFEFAIVKLQGGDVAQSSSQMHPLRRRSKVESLPRQSTPSFATPATSPEATFLWSEENSPVATAEPDMPNLAHRSSAATTLRANVDQPSVPQPRSSFATTLQMTDGHENCSAMLRKEQTARRALEMQVYKLQKHVEKLEMSYFARYTPNACPTPSPESHEHRANLEQRSFGGSVISPISRFGSIQTSRFSQSEDDDDSNTGDENEDNISSNVYESPPQSPLPFRKHMFRIEEASKANAINVI